MNLLSKYVQVYDCSAEWKATAGRAQGYGNNSANANEVPTTGKLYVIPM